MRKKRNLNSSKMTKTLSILVFAFIGIVNCTKAQIIDQGICGTNLTWVLTDDYVLTISGSGEMDDYNSPWNIWWDQILEVVIEENVTTIGKGAFSGIGLLSAIIGNSVISIGEGAFWDCINLQSVIIGNSVATIGDYAFSSCFSLNSIICKANVPPTIIDITYGVVFNNVPIDANIFVPCNSLEDYQTAEYWSYFINYQAIEIIVSDLIVTDINDSFEITWQSEASSYELYRNNQFLATVNTTNYSDNNLTDGVNYCYKIKAMNGVCEGDFSEEVCKIFSISVGITQQQITKFNIYPNPAKNYFNIDCKDFSTVKLYDMLGKEIIIQNTNEKAEININYLPIGIYNVIVFSDGKIIGNSKIMKQ